MMAIVGIFALVLIVWLARKFMSVLLVPMLGMIVLSGVYVGLTTDEVWTGMDWTIIIFCALAVFGVIKETLEKRKSK